MSTAPTFTVTATITDGWKTVTVGKVGHGIMMMSWTPEPVTDEICFESLKASLDAVPEGCKMMINSGEFYGINPREANLELLARFFEKHPSYAGKAFLSVKGGGRFEGSSGRIDGSAEIVRRSILNILSKLRGTKRLDLFEVARVDANIPVEETIRAIADLVLEEKVDFIGMSECKAETLRRGHAVHPIALVEIEVSPWNYDEKVKDVIETSKELGVGIAAYSPLGRGYLAGKFETLDDLPAHDMRRQFDRFLPGNLEANKAIADRIKALAVQKGITSAQLCIAWVCSLGERVIPIPGSSHVSRTTENTAAAGIKLTEEDVAAVKKILADHPVQGARYWPGADEKHNLWG